MRGLYVIFVLCLLYWPILGKKETRNSYRNKRVLTIAANARDHYHSSDPRVDLAGWCIRGKEYFNDVGSSCTRDCVTFLLGRLPCSTPPDSPRLGCFCYTNLVRAGPGGPCVTEEECSKYTVRFSSAIHKDPIHFGK